jgi:hypothetical protein
MSSLYRRLNNIKIKIGKSKRYKYKSTRFYRKFGDDEISAMPGLLALSEYFSIF